MPQWGYRVCPWTTALLTTQGFGQPLRGSALAHRLPASLAFSLTRRCPNETYHQPLSGAPIYSGD
jgi:hypothetical protein